MDPTQPVSLNTAVFRLLDTPAKACVAVLIISIGYLARKALGGYLFKKAAGPYPPGPPRDFLIGTLRSFPKDKLLERFREWALLYGIPFSGPRGNEILKF
jgi:hypothetical protein